MRFLFSLIIISSLLLTFAVKKGWLLVTEQAVSDLNQTKGRIEAWYQKEKEQRIDQPIKEKINQSSKAGQSFIYRIFDWFLEVYQDFFGDRLEVKRSKG